MRYTRYDTRYKEVVVQEVEEVEEVEEGISFYFHFAPDRQSTVISLFYSYSSER
jgi:hypothetical protein